MKKIISYKQEIKNFKQNPENYILDTSQSQTVFGLCIRYLLSIMKSNNKFKYAIYNMYTWIDQLGKLSVFVLSSDHIENWILSRIKAGRKAKTISNNNSVLKNTLAYGIAEGLINKNPATQIRLSNFDFPTEQITIINPNYFPPSARHIFFQNAQNLHGREFELVLLIKNELCLFPAELFGIMPQDIDFDTGKLTINRTLRDGEIRKLAKPKMIEIGPWAKHWLKELLSKQAEHKKFTCDVQTKSGKPCNSTRSFYYRMNELARACKVNFINNNDWRHSRIAVLIQLRETAGKISQKIGVSPSRIRRHIALYHKKATNGLPHYKRAS